MNNHQEIHIINAFTDRPFGGNPAAICVVDRWPEEEWMQQVAAQNNLSETAFVLQSDRLAIRWFTPACEVDLCGHATLAAAFVLFGHYGYEHEVVFDSRSGPLGVAQKGDRLQMDFPADTPKPLTDPIDWAKALGTKPVETWRGKEDALILLPNEAAVQNLAPDLAEIARLPFRGVIVTASDCAGEFVSRFFAPRFGILEDPATGSAHTLLAPFWANRQDRTTFTARQLSKRGAELYCTLSGDRVLIGGKAVVYLQGTIPAFGTNG